MTNGSPTVTYHQRYCAFVDVLGFSALISQLGRGIIPPEELRSLLEIVHNPAGGMEQFEESDIRSQSISDAVCISTRTTNSGLSQLFFALTELTLRMLSKGFFVRGAVVKDYLYHDDKIVFGEEWLSVDACSVGRRKMKVLPENQKVCYYLWTRRPLSKRAAYGVRRSSAS